MAPPPGLTSAEYTGPFNTAFDQVRENIRNAMDSFNSLVSTVNHWSWAFGLAAWYWIKRNLDGVREGLAAIIDKVNYAAEHQMPVLSLITTSFDWVYTVKTPASDLSFATTEPRNE